MEIRYCDASFLEVEMAFLPLKSAFKNQVFTAVRTSISGTDEIDTVIKHASSIRKKKQKKNGI